MGQVVALRHIATHGHQSVEDLAILDTFGHDPDAQGVAKIDGGTNDGLVDPTDPTDPTEPTDPTDPTEPTGGTHHSACRKQQLSE